MGIMKPDILVLSANPGGLCAAISAARKGMNVLVLEPTSLVGGMNGNGVFGFDATRRAALSGLALEFEQIVKDHYRDLGQDDPVFHSRSDQVWETFANRECWQKFIGSTRNLKVLTGAVPVDAVVEDGRISQVHWQPATDVFGTPDTSSVPNIVAPRIVVDASYEGDILEWAGVPYTIGREPRSWDEPHAGKIYTSDMGQAPNGLMAHSVLPGSSGEGDGGVSAFAMRLPCKWYEDTSDDATHRIKEPPRGYDPSEFAWRPQAIDEDGNPKWFKGLYVLVGDKFLVNRMILGNDISGAARDYILAHPKDRPAYRQAIMDYSWSYLYYIQTEGGTPQLGLAQDDFPENGGMPYLPYIRAGRRIEGEYVLTESDVNPFIKGDGFRPPKKSDAVAIGDWIFESHACVDQLEDGYSFPEGWLFSRVTQCPYQMPYGSLLPKAVDNLLVCGSISATHIGFSATRCEAFRMQSGIAAGLAAALSLDAACDPRALPVEQLQSEIVEQGGKLVYFGDLDQEHPDYAEIQWAGLHGYLPKHDLWYFLPSHPVSWSELVQLLVTVLGLPISVTGEHFEGVGRRDPIFRYVESIYDLGTRSGVDIFDARDLKHEDPMVAILRLYPASRLIPFSKTGVPTMTEAVQFLMRVEEALFDGRPSRVTSVIDTGETLLSRAEFCRALHSLRGLADLRPHEAIARRH